MTPAQSNQAQPACEGSHSGRRRETRRIRLNTGEETTYTLPGSISPGWQTLRRHWLSLWSSLLDSWDKLLGDTQSRRRHQPLHDGEEALSEQCQHRDSDRADQQINLMHLLGKPDDDIVA